MYYKSNKYELSRNKIDRYMTAKEFVKTHYPKAVSERQVSGMIKGLQTVYYLIRIDRKSNGYFASGNSESNAWVNAKKKIIEKINLTSNI